MTIKEKIQEITANTNSINQQELVAMFLKLRNGAHTFGSIVALTTPPMNKTGNPFYDRVSKLAKWSFGVNTEYYEKWENRLRKKGISPDTITKVPSNYIRYDEQRANCPVLKLKSDNSKLYLGLFPNKDKVSFVEYYLDNNATNEFEEAQIKAWIKENKPSAKQLASGIDEDDEVLLRTININNVVMITVSGVTYSVVK